MHKAVAQSSRCTAFLQIISQSELKPVAAHMWPTRRTARLRGTTLRTQSRNRGTQLRPMRQEVPTRPCPPRRWRNQSDKLEDSVRTHTYTPQTHTHTRINTYTHTHTHTRIHAYTYTYTIVTLTSCAVRNHLDGFSAFVPPDIVSECRRTPVTPSISMTTVFEAAFDEKVTSPPSPCVGHMYIRADTISYTYTSEAASTSYARLYRHFNTSVRSWRQFPPFPPLNDLNCAPTVHETPYRRLERNSLVTEPDRHQHILRVANICNRQIIWRGQYAYTHATTHSTIPHVYGIRHTHSLAGTPAPQRARTRVQVRIPRQRPLQRVLDDLKPHYEDGVHAELVVCGAQRRTGAQCGAPADGSL